MTILTVLRYDYQIFLYFFLINFIIDTLYLFLPYIRIVLISYSNNR